MLYSIKRKSAGFVRLNILSLVFVLTLPSTMAAAQGTRLLRQPSISTTQVAFIYGADVWVADLNGQNVLRITSTAAVETDPHFSPDGKWIAFTSNRSGSNAVYIVSVKGGEPTRLTWHPANSQARGWTNDGTKVLYASDRETAPTTYNRLWTVPVSGGPSSLLAKQWGNDGSYSPDGKQIVVDKMDRWDVEWRAYRGGQNTPLIVLNLSDFSEHLLPNPSTIDIQPLWLGSTIYFLSDRDGGVANIWSYQPSNGAVSAVTKFKGSDVKWVSGQGNKLIFERDGFLHLLDISNSKDQQLSITVVGDFPWAETKWRM